MYDCRHPDKNKDPSANEKFMKINEAYEVILPYYFKFINIGATQ
jgi:hypothetical protein